MNEVFWRVVPPALCGMILWAISKRFYLKDYGPQSLQWRDLGFVAFSAVWLALYERNVFPLIAGSVQNLEIRSFFRSMHPLAQLACYTVAADFGSYWMHRFEHSRAIWPIHAFHHSAKTLDWLTGLRGSPVHQVLVFLPFSISAAIMLHIHGHAVAAGILAFNSIFVQHWIHTGIRIPFERQIEWLFITPRSHFVHHHPDPRYTNTNYGFMFSIWDRAFGTYTCPESIPRAKRGQLGLDYEQPNWEMFLGLPRRGSKRASRTPLRRSA